MKSGLSGGFLLAYFVMILAIPAVVSAQTPGSAPSLAAPSGVTLTGIIECGEGYTSHELYDIKITLLEVIRGDEAWKRVKEASDSNKPADADSEYILARIRFEYFARGTPGLCVHQVVPEQFAAYSAKGEDYKPALVVLPKPEVRKGLKSGESLEGWVAFMVAQKDKTPLMSYSADAGGAVQHGGDKWFLLR